MERHGAALVLDMLLMVFGAAMDLAALAMGGSLAIAEAG